MIERFLEYILVEKRYSAHTFTSYKKDLEDFSSFLFETESTNDLLKVDRRIIKNYIYYLSENKLANRSINRKLSSLKSFYLFSLKIREIETSPLENISTLKFYAEKQIPISEDEMQDLEKIYIKNNIPILEKLIIETLYQTGMREAELCNLLLENIDFSNKQLKILGTGNKERIIPVSDNLLGDFQEYSMIRKPTSSVEKYFFVLENGKKLYEKFVYLTVNKYLGLVTSKKKKSPHMLRHSFATHTLNRGAEISKIKKIMGHSSLASTQVYTNANIEQLKKVFNQAHPRAIKKEEL